MNGEVIVNILYNNGLIDEADKKLYAYAVNSAIMFVAPVMLALIIGAALGHLGVCMMYVLLFVVLRKFTGGYHARHRITCLIISIMIIVVSTVTACVMTDLVKLLILEAFGIITILLTSPEEHCNYRLNPDEKRTFRMIAYVLTFAYIVLQVIFWTAGNRELFNCVALVLIWVGALSCLQHIENKSCECTK